MAVKDIGPRIGADPEIFVVNSETKEIVPICGQIGGTKENPIPISDEVSHIYGQEQIRGVPVDCRGMYAVQEDNVMLEFNVPAYKEYSLFGSAIEKALNTIQAKYLSPKGLEYKFGVADHGFKSETLAKYAQASTIGCVCDLNAYAEKGRFEREPFSSMDFGNRRFCGGHIHVQYDTDKVPSHIFAQFMDCFACLSMLGWDRQRGRRMFYGQPGIYRKKHYGIEYRTLSNFWLDPKFRGAGGLSTLSSQVISLATIANIAPYRLQQWYAVIPWDDVQNAIKTEDSKLANQLVDYMAGKLGMDIVFFRRSEQRVEE